jgi:type III secretory pathway component EscV
MGSVVKETAKPNVEVTGRRRMDALPARCSIDSERRAGKVASRWRSG